VHGSDNSRAKAPMIFGQPDFSALKDGVRGFAWFARAKATDQE